MPGSLLKSRTASWVYCAALVLGCTVNETDTLQSDTSALSGRSRTVPKEVPGRCAQRNVPGPVRDTIVRDIVIIPPSQSSHLPVRLSLYPGVRGVEPGNGKFVGDGLSFGLWIYDSLPKGSAPVDLPSFSRTDCFHGCPGITGYHACTDSVGDPARFVRVEVAQVLYRNPAMGDSSAPLLPLGVIAHWEIRPGRWLVFLGYSRDSTRREVLLATVRSVGY